MNIDLLRELSEAHGTSGFEDDLRIIVRRELGSLGNLSSDALGNVCLHKHPTKSTSNPRKVMIAAHTDEIGFVVRHIDSAGFLKISPLGGFDPRQLNSQRVTVRTASGYVPGLLCYGAKPAHLLTEAEKNEGQKLANFFVDLGLPGEEVMAMVSIGDPVTLVRSFSQIGNLVSGKCMDDRVGVFVMIEAMKALKDHAVEVYAVATAQEEIGLRGATAAGSAIKPDVVIALDVTLANDAAGSSETDMITKLGDGTAIKVLDSSLICNPRLVSHFKEVATNHGIKYQLEVLSGGGTDAGGIQRLNGGIPAFTLSIPCRYVHTVNETVHPEDVQASIELLARWLEEAETKDYTL